MNRTNPIFVMLLLLAGAFAIPVHPQTPKTSTPDLESVRKLAELDINLKCPSCDATVDLSGTQLIIHLPHMTAAQFEEEKRSVLPPDALTSFAKYGITRLILTNDSGLSFAKDVVPATSPAPVSSSPQPFGFKEGMTLDQIRSAVGGEAIKGVKDNVVELSTAPTPNSFFDGYLVVVSPVEGLVKVIGVGRTIATGDTGAELRSEFQAIAAGVSQKYGPPTKVFDFCNGGTGCDSSEYWMMSLLEKNRTLDATWDRSRIMLETRALNLNTGYVSFSLEFPSFDAYSDRKDAQQNSTF